MSAITKQKITLAYYKTNVGVFIRNLWGSEYSGYQGTPHFDIYKFNGIAGHNNLVGSFMLLKGEQGIDKVERKKEPRALLVGYKMKEDVSEALKAALKPSYVLDEVGYHYDDSIEEYVFSNKEFDAIKAMYLPEYAMTEESWEEVPVEHVVLGELTIENYEQPDKMVVKVQEDRSWSSEAVDVDLASIVCYEDFERMLTPGFMLHTRPCSLSSPQVYKIIRAYVKQNINPRVAEITSDYDFCFTVSRKVAIKPITTKREQKKANGRSYATPRFSTQTISYKSIPLFEMTDSSHRYQGYTVIEGWEANNLQEMKEQVKHYLDTLMEEINTEWKECECCGGIGAIGSKIDTNERNV